MLKKIIQCVHTPKPDRLIPRILHADQHPITIKHISSAAQKVLEALHKAEYQSYLVGGSVRDLMLHKTPKDFDVATDATPDQVRSLFRNARIIGRRFRLVHVQFGHEIVEVATFRAHHEADEKTLKSQAHTSASGMIIRDNVFGSIEQDAERRDFTINALYFQYPLLCVHDFTHGVSDLNHQRLRLIGHPETRYREDPVRILRAIRFAARLEFTLDPDTAAPLKSLSNLLTQVSAHRLFDEVIKLFACGRSKRVLELMQEYGLLPLLFPDIHLTDQSLKLIHATADNTDRRIAEGKSINPAFFLATLLWQNVCDRQVQLQNHGVALSPSWQQAAHQILHHQNQRTALTRFVQTVIREIWEMQPKLEHPDLRNATSLIATPRFRAAFDFLVLRESAGEATAQMGNWWERYQLADHGLQVEMQRTLQETQSVTRKKRSRRPTQRKKSAIGD